jgi:hypothetical protein
MLSMLSQRPRKTTPPKKKTITTQTLNHETKPNTPPKKKHQYGLNIYSALCCASAVSIIVTLLCFTLSGIRAARKFHEGILGCLLRAPMVSTVVRCVYCMVIVGYKKRQGRARPAGHATDRLVMI